MSIGITGAVTAIATAKRAVDLFAPKPKADFEQILEGFKKAASQTPAEKARERVLEKHKLSEAEYEKLPPEKRKVVDEEIAAAVRKVTERKTGVALPDQPWTTAKLFG